MRVHHAVLALASCAVIGGVVAVEPRAFVAILVLCAIASVSVLAYRRPREALTFAIALVLVAATKVRNRDAQAALANPADNQILLELGLYAMIALITVVVAIAPTFPARRLDVRERMLAAFVALTLVSTLWSDAPMMTLVRGVQLAILLALSLVVIRVQDVAGTLHALGTANVVYVLLCAAIAVAFPFTRITATEVGTVALAKERFSWFAMHSISAATFTAIAILYVLCIALFLPRGWRQWRAGLPVSVALVPLCVIMLATESRGPLFALVGAIAAVVAVRSFRPVTSLAVAGVITLGALAASIAGVTPTTVLEDAAGSSSPIAALVLRGQDVREFSSLTGRTELWSKVVPLYLKSPVIGYGYLGSRDLLLQVVPWAGHAHNGFLQTLLDLGVVGALLLWTPFLLSLFARPPAPPLQAWSPGAHVERWAGASVFAVLMFTMLNSMSDVGLAGSPSYEILLFLCAVIAAERLARREAPAVEAARRSIRVVRRARTSTAL
jgi:hypothetical protein